MEKKEKKKQAFAFTFLGLFLLVTLPASVRGQSVSVSNVTAAYQQQAVLGCSLTGYSGSSPVDISIERVDSSPLPSLVFARQNFSATWTLLAANYTDMGEYRCIVTIVADRAFQVTFYLQIEGYQAPTGRPEFGLVKSSETPLVECPVEGVPGPARFYWQSGDEDNAPRVTENTAVVSGPFVDSEGRLDLTRAVVSDSGLYRCTGVDVVGASGSQLFNVLIVDNGVNIADLVTQWYFILVYIIVGLVLLVLVIFLPWCCYASRRYWLDKSTVRVRKRVSKKKYANTRRKSQSTGQPGMELVHGPKGGSKGGPKGGSKGGPKGGPKDIGGTDDYNYDMFESK